MHHVIEEELLIEPMMRGKLPCKERGQASREYVLISRDGGPIFSIGVSMVDDRGATSCGLVDGANDVFNVGRSELALVTPSSWDWLPGPRGAGLRSGRRADLREIRWGIPGEGKRLGRAAIRCSICTRLWSKQEIAVSDKVE